jgi:nucleotide-binding universal stress UspA family protein
MERILVPTDFSRESENALQTAILIAKASGAKLILLHILEVTSNKILGKNNSTDEISNSVHLEDELAGVKENFKRSVKLHNLQGSGIKYDEVIRIGSVSKSLEAFIEAENIDFVVMGTKSAWGLNDILLGTTTDKLLRRINCPVLSVNKVVPVETFNKIVFPTTTLTKETKLIKIIKQFQKLFGAKIYLVRINTPVNFIPDKESIQLLEAYATEHDIANYESSVFGHTMEEDGIRDFADLKDAGLIAMATSAHTGLWKIIQGSVAKELVSHSTRPVLTVRLDNK